MEKYLIKVGCKVVKVSDGEMAVSQAQRQDFDAAVIVSTGNKMDLTETVLNIRDVRAAMPILIVAGMGAVGQTSVRKAMIAHSVPRTKVLSLQELKNFLESIKNAKDNEQRRRA